MPDYADNFTARYKLSYFSGGMGHTQLWRMGSAANVSAATSAINSLTDLWEQIAPTMSSDLAFTGAVFIPVGSSVALPAPLPSNIALLTGSLTQDDSAGPKYLSVPWKTIVGGQQTTFFYGVTNDPSGITGDNYRYEVGENSVIDNTITAMSAVLVLMTGNDGQPGYGPASYANYGVNPHLVKKKRKG